MSDSDVIVSGISLRISTKNKFKDMTYELTMRDIMKEDIMNMFSHLKPVDKIDGIYLWVNYEYEKENQRKCFAMAHDRDSQRGNIEITIKETRSLLSKFPELLI